MKHRRTQTSCVLAGIGPSALAIRALVIAHLAGFAPKRVPPLDIVAAVVQAVEERRLS